MKLASIFFAFASATAGFFAAYYWYRASQINISPAWELDPRGDRERNIMGWVTGNMIAFTKSGKMNRYAALWSAIAATFAGTSALVSSLY
jgi:hypothetical protein